MKGRGFDDKNGYWPTERAFEALGRDVPDHPLYVLRRRVLRRRGRRKR